MESSKSVDVLNSLIEINNDRIEGYSTALKETQQADLKQFFAECEQTSRKCRNELVSEVQKLGGKPEEGTKTTGKFYRVWMDFKAAVTGNDRKAILSSCEFGEDAAVDTYKKALDNKADLNGDLHKLISSQYLLINAEHSKVKTMRDRA